MLRFSLHLGSAGLLVQACRLVPLAAEVDSLACEMDVDAIAQAKGGQLLGPAHARVPVADLPPGWCKAVITSTTDMVRRCLRDDREEDMPYINGTYRLPESTPGGIPDPLHAAHLRLRSYLWNVLAYRYDGDDHSAARWQRRAWEAAGHLRTMLNPTEAASAISDAARQAKSTFAQDLTGAEDWRPRRGIEPRLR